MENPFLGSFADRVPLRPDPLARVLVQLVYQPVMKIGTPDGLAKFQDAIRSRYPTVQSMKELLEIGEIDAQGEHKAPHKTVTGLLYQFISSDGASRLTVADNALTLETAHYVSREDFLEELRFILECFLPEYSPVITRIGFRYVNRISAVGDDGELLTPTLVRKELLGLHGLFAGNPPQRELSDARFSVPEGMVIMTWGHTEPNYVHAPEVLMPTRVPAWVVDIDTITNDANMEIIGTTELLDSLVEKIKDLADRGRTVFNWCVTSEFLEMFKKEES